MSGLSGVTQARGPRSESPICPAVKTIAWGLRQQPSWRRAGGLMRVFLDRLYLFAGYAAGAFLVLIFPAGDDIAAWCMAAMAFLGLAHTFKRGEIIRVGVLIEKVSGRKRWALEV